MRVAEFGAFAFGPSADNFGRFEACNELASAIA
jgi:hypothetical protein